MRTITYQDLLTKFTTMRGVDALLDHEKLDFTNSLNHRIKQIWTKHKWPDLTVVIERKLLAINTDTVKADKAISLEDDRDLLDVYGVFSGNPYEERTAQRFEYTLIDNHIILPKGIKVDSVFIVGSKVPADNYEDIDPLAPPVVGEQRKVVEAWTAGANTAVVDEIVTVNFLQIDADGEIIGVVFTRADGSNLQGGIDRYRDKTKPFFGYIEQPYFQLPTEPNNGHDSNYTFPVEERPIVIAKSSSSLLIEGSYYRLHVYNTSTGTGRIYTLDGQQVKVFALRGIDWELVKEAKDLNTSIPAFMESMLISYTMADHYRADGQNEKSMIEEKKGDEQMQDALDRFERLEGQNRVPVVTYPPRSLGITRVTTQRNV